MSIMHGSSDKRQLLPPPPLRAARQPVTVWVGAQRRKILRRLAADRSKIYQEDRRSSARVPGCQKLQMTTRLNPLGHRMLYSCNHMK